MRTYCLKEMPQKLLNGRVKIYLLLVWFSISCVSCIKQVNLYQSDDEKRGE